MFFICFSHEERYIIAQSLSYHLKNFGFEVWYDYDKLFIGDIGDKLNFDEGLFISDYVIIILSSNIFQSPCALSELNQIYDLYTKDKITILPILYKLDFKMIPEKFHWIKNFIYAEIVDLSEIIDIATQIASKYLEDIIRKKNLSLSCNLNIKTSPFIEEIIKCYNCIDKNNINSRATILYILNTYLATNYDFNYPKFCTQSVRYLYQLTNLNISINFKEISLMENSTILLYNLVNDCSNL